MITAVANLGLAVLTARVLSASGRGELVVVVTVTSLATVLFGLGTNFSYRHFRGRNDPRVGFGDYFGFSLVAAVPAATASTAVTVLTLRAVGAPAAGTAMVAVTAALSCAHLLSWQVSDAVNAVGAIWQTAAVAAVLTVGQFVGVLLLSVVSPLPTVVTVLALVALGWTGQLVVCLVLLARLGVRLRPRISLTAWRLLVVSGSPSLGLGLGVAFRLDRYLVALFAGRSAAGVYSVAAAACECLRLIPGAFGQVLFHRAATRQATAEQLRAVRNWTLVGVGAAGAVLVVVAPWLVRTVFGPDYADAVTPLRVLVLAELVLVPYLLTGRVLVGLGRSAAAGLTGLLGLVASTACYLALVPAYGLVGGAVGSVLGYGVLTVAAGLALRRSRDDLPDRPLPRPRHRPRPWPNRRLAGGRNMKIATLVKTGDGPLWVVPQVLAARAAGHEVVVLLPPPDHTDSQLARVLVGHGVTVVSTPAPVRRGTPVEQFVGVLRLRRLLRRIGVDVVHYHLYASALAVRFATLGTPIVRVHTVAGPLYLDNRLIRQVERVLCRLDDMLIASTGDIRDQYRALGVPARRIRELPYGVDLVRFTPASAEVRQAARAGLDLSDSEFVAVCVAYFYPPKRTVFPGRGVKGHEVLLRAWADYVRNGGTGTLLLVGGGYQDAGERYRQQLRGRAAGLPGAGSVRWVDTVADVRPYHAAADVNVVASWSEGYGASMEASACGVPTIATAVGGLPEMVDAETGWLVAPGDAAALAARLADAAAARGTSALADRAMAARQRAEKMLDRDALSADVAVALTQAGRGRWEPRWYHAGVVPGVTKVTTRSSRWDRW